MVDLRAKPYYLNDEDIAWVENTITAMTDATQYITYRRQRTQEL